LLYNSSYTNRGYDLQLNLTQTVFDFRKFANLCQARALSRQAEATLNAETQSLMIRVAKAYFSVLEDADNLRYSEANKSAYAKQLDQVTQQYKVGLKTITDVYTAQASYDGAVADYIATENQLANDKENLRVITGVLYPELAKLSEDFPLISPQPINMETWVQTSLRQNWYIKSAQYAEQAASANIKQQFAGHLPTMDVQGIYDKNYDRQVSGGSLLQPLGTTITHTRTVNINLNIPIFEGGLVVAQTRKAQYDYRVKSAALEKQFRDAVNLTRQSYLGVISGISKIKADKQAVKSNLSSLEGMNEGYRVGTETLVNVLNQQKQLFQAQKQYASDRYLYVNNLLALKQAAGTLSVQDLSAINAWLRGKHEAEFHGYKQSGGIR
jgi:outer membrane protein